MTERKDTSMNIKQGKTLFLAEKPTVARVLARILECREEYPGYWEGDRDIVTWCNGHRLTLPPPMLNAPEDELLFPDGWDLAPIPEGAEQLHIIGMLLRREDLTGVVNACDNDREGDLIFQNIMDYLDCELPADRLVLTSCTDHGIRLALTKIRPMRSFERRCDAARCRVMTDWILAANIPRMFFSGMESAPPSFGRTQMAVLHLLEQREEAMKRSREETPWRVTLTTVRGQSMVSEDLSFREAKKARRRAPGKIISAGLILENPRELTEEPYDLTSLQAAAGPALGLAPDRITEILRDLHRRGLVTYPRTGSRVIPRELLDDAVKGLFAIAGRSPGDTRGEGCWERWRDPDKICRGETAAHPPLLVMPAATPEEILKCSPEEKYLLAHIAFQTMKSFCLPDICHETDLFMQCDEVHYSMGGDWYSSPVPLVELTVPGYGTLRQEGMQEPEEDLTMADFVEEAEIRPCAPLLGAYTEAELLSAMSGCEDTQPVPIGTAGTRGGIIGKLIRNGLATRRDGTIRPTERGRWVLRRLPEELTSPEFTAEMERQLECVEMGSLTDMEYLDELMEMMERLMDQAQELPEIPGDRVTGTCPVCGKPVLEGDRNFHCSDRSCRFVLWKDLYLPWHDSVRVERKDAETLLETGLCTVECDDGGSAQIVLNDQGLPRARRLLRPDAA